MVRASRLMLVLLGTSCSGSDPPAASAETETTGAAESSTSSAGIETTLPTGSTSDGGSAVDGSGSTGSGCEQIGLAGCQLWEIPTVERCYDLELSNGLVVADLEGERVLAVDVATGEVELDLTTPIFALAVNATDIFWSHQTGPVTSEIVRRPRDGGEPTIVGELSSPCFALAATSLELFCWSSGAEIHRVDIATGVNEVLGTSQGPQGGNFDFVVVDDDVYYVDFGGIVKVAPGAEPTGFPTKYFNADFAVGRGAAYLGLGYSLARLDLTTLATTLLDTSTSPSWGVYGVDSSHRVLFGSADLTLTTPAFDADMSLEIGGVDDAVMSDEFLVACIYTRIIGVARPQ